MKFERINSNQIRCTLTVNDLASRRIRISELAYGNERTRALFKEMIAQASSELGFEIDDTPLMLEAVPMSGECLVLTITKIPDPEELDTRFSHFTPFTEYDFDDEDEDSDEDPSQDFMSMLRELGNHLFGGAEIAGIPAETLPYYPVMEANAQAEAEKQLRTFASQERIFEFEDLDTLHLLSSELPETFSCDNILYKNPVTDRYFLVLASGAENAADFVTANELCREYGEPAKSGNSALGYLREHCAVIIREKALQVLRSI
ncbi:MAG: adaptor protein MecA [Lachnospiraceae bacterium]|nr:adaptor protein MecA [Lachnospiraceae bacterium]